MDCPHCDQPLEQVLYEGIRVDTCSRCLGEWLDAGELKSIIDNWERRFTPAEVQQLDAIDRADFTLDEEHVERSCPRCPSVNMERFNYAATSGIALDKCPTCAGIWFDDRELERVQILSEEWSKKLGADLAQYGDLHQKVSARIEERVDSAVAVSRFGVFNSILKRLF